MQRRDRGRLPSDPSWIRGGWAERWKESGSPFRRRALMVHPAPGIPQDGRSLVYPPLQVGLKLPTRQIPRLRPLIPPSRQCAPASSGMRPRRIPSRSFSCPITKHQLTSRRPRVSMLQPLSAARPPDARAWPADQRSRRARRQDENSGSSPIH